MAYWWVSQNKTFTHERDGGYLWAPKRDAAGKTPHHWATMCAVQPGDTIFSYVNQAIVAVAIANSAAYDSDRPGEFGPDPSWFQDGRRVDATYRPVQPPLAVRALLPDLIPLLPERYSPLTAGGTGNQGYLFSLPPRAGRLLVERLKVAHRAGSEAIVDAILASPLPTTQRRALVDSRVGQGRFRDDLLRLWNGRCCVTGLDVGRLLRASHIKPWRDGNNAERLDPYNGLLLGPAYDAAFDAGYVSFDDGGRLLLSPRLSATQLTQLGLHREARVSNLTECHLRYLAYHREAVFQTGLG